MKWIAILLFCLATAFAQQPPPNHISHDSIGESVDQYVDNNPDCRFVSSPAPSRVKPRQRERTVLCVPFEGTYTLNTLEPNSTYGSVSLTSLDTTFLDEDGLVSLVFEVRRTDFDQLKTQLFMEFGLPDQVSRFNGETITWDDGLSRIDLQRGDPGDDVSYLFLSQDDYLWKGILFDVSNGRGGDTQVKVIDGDLVILKGPENAQIKVRIVN